MAKTVEQIREQIAVLKAQEQKLLAREVDGVVSRIREAIAHYGLTSDQLFGAGKAPAGRVSPRSKAKAGPSVQDGEETQPAGRSASNKRSDKLKGVKIAPKYKDKQGNTWTGRGNQPRWLRAALETGKTLEEFTI